MSAKFEGGDDPELGAQKGIVFMEVDADIAAAVADAMAASMSLSPASHLEADPMEGGVEDAPAGVSYSYSDLGYARTTIEDLEQLPSGGAIIVPQDAVAPRGVYSIDTRPDEAAGGEHTA